MKNLNRNIIKSFILFLIVMAPLATMAQKTYKVKSSEVTIAGDSNLQKWTADVNKTTGTVKATLENNKIVKIEEANIVFDATSIEGSEGRRMDNKINDALDIRNHPTITFNLRAINSLTENPGTARINANGVITIAGVSRTVSLNTVGKVLPNGDLQFSGSQDLKMTDHRVSPPTALLGTLKTRDEITINYTVIMSAQ